MQNQVQRTILWVIFFSSIFFLWDAWQRDQGQPGIFAPIVERPADGGATRSGSQGSASTDSAVPGSVAGSPSSASGVPSATGGTSASSEAGGGAAGTAPAPTGEARTGAQDPSVPAAKAGAVGDGRASGGTGQVPGVLGQDRPTSAVSADKGADKALATGDSAARGAGPPVWVLQSDTLKLSIHPEGGQVVRAELLKQREIADPSRNVVLMEQRGDRQYVAQTGWIAAGRAAGFPTHRTAFALLQQSDRELVIESVAGELRVRRSYSIEPGQYIVHVADEVSNLGTAAVEPIVYRQLLRDGKAPEGESQFYATYTGPVVYTEQGKFQKVDFSSIDKAKADHIKQASDGWLGVIQHHFIAAWVPEPQRPREYFTRRVDGNPVLYSVGAMESLGELPPGSSAKTAATLLIGPQDQRMLAAIAPGLDLAVDYGWLSMFAIPIFWLLENLHGVSGNWGVAIILLTIIIKTLFFPLQSASYKSMARMKAVTPRMMAIRERYASDRVRMNQAMMELYKEEKINPLGGCLPIVVQIPVFIALYWVLLASSEMRFAPFLYLDNLAAPDSLFGTYVGVPVGLMPILMAATMFIQTKLNPTPPDPVQAKLMTIMPIVFSVMFFFFPSGLVLYWLVNNIYSIAQQWVITRQIEAQSAKERRS